MRVPFRRMHREAMLPGPLRVVANEGRYGKWDAIHVGFRSLPELQS